ncbi:MAG: hypothetical protein JWL69_659 [Phycisphaerales bacterium]|nr:hypothetical protein [Phycisphaerales bacterium]
MMLRGSRIAIIMTMRCRFLVALLLLGACALPCPRAAGQDHRAFAEQQRRYRESVKLKPQVSKHRIEDVFQAHLKGDELVIEPRLAAEREYTERGAVLEGLPEPAVIICWEFSQDLGQVQFEFSYEDYSQPGTCRRVHVQSRPPNQVEFEENTQTPAGFRNVTFSQANNAVMLSVVGNDGVGGFMNVHVMEQDFLTLRRNHPAEIDQWLRPLLREMHQEAAFAPEPGAVWQILADEWPVDGRFGGQVRAKVPALDDDNFHVRRKAADDLQKLGRDAALAIWKMDRRGLTLEQNLRLDEVVARFKPLTDSEAARLADDPHFLLDCLYSDDATARKLALRRLKKVTGKDIDFDPDAPDESRLPAVAALRAKLFPDDKGMKKP